MKKRIWVLFALVMCLALEGAAADGLNDSQSSLAAPKGGETGIIVGVTLEQLGEYPVLSEENETPEDWGTQVKDVIKSMMHTQTPAIRLLQNGCYVVNGGGDGVNRVGLFDDTGTPLIPFEAAVIRELGNHSGEDTGRYLAVYYATKQTTDRNKALIYLSDGSWIGGNVPGDNDVMYEGYVRFYDLQRRRFVPELESTGNHSSCGSLLVVGKKVYDADGKQVADKLTAGNGYLIRNTSPKEVYDEALTLRFTSDLQLSVLTSTSGYLKQYDPGKGYRVIDMDGSPVVEGWFKSVTEEKYGILSAQRADGAYVLQTVDGRVLAESRKPITCLSGGYYYTDDDGSFTFVKYDGMTVPGMRRPQGNLQVYDQESGSDARTLVLNTGEMALPFGRGWDLGIGLMGAYSPDNHKMGVIDLFTGEQLLPFEYDKIRLSGGLIYAAAGETQSVFRPRYRRQAGLSPD